ncbi:flagellar basal body P-ring formation chaperone FlgA [Marinobacterium arenosum]|uniref:flagellar basal body P-ring formation chaperone FlgA n=1 Tax=Marinobacterium arenosum TaxID=2862496 RepID=UPI001C9383F6|nr:flagellar basal body P-ring formation chaperone FlgA [Marinobacterium arenosum]MBY4675915.1 flagellar basal body P-ring formation chaperone FlgA [Marinobacterium arenosum]
MPLYSFGQETTSAIEQQAAKFLHQHYREQFPGALIEVNVNPINNLVSRKRCTTPLRFTTPKTSSSRVVIKASCNAPLWSLFISANVSASRNGLTAAVRIRRGERISSKHLRIQSLDMIRHSDSLATPEQAIGKIANRTLSAGRIISSGDLQVAAAVSKGDSVIIEAQRNGVVIRATGIAQQQGQVGDQIRVTNSRSGKEVKAEVIGKGLVRTP